MNMNLTEEGVCNDPSEIVGISTAKTPAPSYKRDNQDLKPDDKPFVTILLKDGRYFHFMLSVVDKASSLGHWKRNHLNDTRYVHAHQSVNWQNKELQTKT
jgi:hypothetical protein